METLENKTLMEPLPFCTELYEVLTRSEEKQFRLTFAPDQETITERYYHIIDDNFAEVVCFKRTYLSVFKECHEYFSGNRLEDPAECFDTYKATVGFLLTTPGNNTALNLHWKTLQEQLMNSSLIPSGKLEFLRREMTLVGRLLTSTNNRLNKASSLWCLYRKIYLMIRDTDICHLDYISVFTTSGSRHFSNYYCWATARWFFDVTPQPVQTNILVATKTFCFRNAKDSSSWDALAYMVSQVKLQNRFNWDNCLRLKESMSHVTHKDAVPSWPSFNTQSIASEIANYINDLTIVEWPPFLCLLKISLVFSPISSSTLCVDWKDEVEAFEQQYGNLKFVRGKPCSPLSVSENLLISTRASNVAYKKRFLENLESHRG